ncbi:tryptophan synthetase, partial [Tulasnella sp. 403]
MEALRNVFAERKREGVPAFVTFVTAGFPTPADTVPMLLAMEKGGADIIELGMPFSDPMADGPAIQESNTIALNHGVGFQETLDCVAEARKLGLKTPVILMGYYNPILAYGEEKSVQAARRVGANGFIVVDLPPEEAVRFREICAKEDVSYIPLVAPSTTLGRIKFLASIADSFMYIVSK